MIGDVVAFPSGQTHLVWRIEAIRGRNIQIQRGPMRVWVLWSHVNSLRSGDGKTNRKKEKTPPKVWRRRWGFFNPSKQSKGHKIWHKITSPLRPSKRN